MVHPHPFQGDDAMEDAVRLAVRVLHQCNRLPAGRFRKRLLRDTVNEISSALEMNILEARKAARKKALEESKVDACAVGDVSRAARRNSHRRRRVSNSSVIDNDCDVGINSRRNSRPHEALTSDVLSSGEDSDVVAIAMDGSSSRSNKCQSSRPRRSRRVHSRRPPPGQSKSHNSLLLGALRDRPSLDIHGLSDSNSDSKISHPKRRSSRIAYAAAAALQSGVNAEEAENVAKQQPEIENLESEERSSVSDESDWSDSVELALPVVRPRPYVGPKPLISDWASRTPILSTDDEETDVEVDDIRRARRYAQLLLERFEKRMQQKDIKRAKAIASGDENALMEISEPETESDKDDVDWQPEADWNAVNIDELAVPFVAQPSLPEQVSLNVHNLHNTHPYMFTAQQLQAQAAAAARSRFHVQQAPLSAGHWNPEIMSRMLRAQQHPSLFQNLGGISQPHSLYKATALPRPSRTLSQQPHLNYTSQSPQVWPSGIRPSVPSTGSNAHHTVSANHVPINVSYPQPLTHDLHQREVQARIQAQRETSSYHAQALEQARRHAHANARAQAKLRLHLQMQSRFNPQLHHPSQVLPRASHVAHLPAHLVQAKEHSRVNAQIHAQMQSHPHAHASQPYLVHQTITHQRRPHQVSSSSQQQLMNVAYATPTEAAIMPLGTNSTALSTTQHGASLGQLAQNTTPTASFPNVPLSTNHVQAQEMLLNQMVAKARAQQPLSRTQDTPLISSQLHPTYQMHLQSHQPSARNMPNTARSPMMPALRQSLTPPITNTVQNLAQSAPPNFVASHTFAPQLSEHNALRLQNANNLVANQKQPCTSNSAQLCLSNRFVSAHQDSSKGLTHVTVPNSAATEACQLQAYLHPQLNGMSEQLSFTASQTGPEIPASSGSQRHSVEAIGWPRGAQNYARNSVGVIPYPQARNAVSQAGTVLQHQTTTNVNSNNAPMSIPSNTIISSNAGIPAKPLTLQNNTAVVASVKVSMGIPVQASAILHSQTGKAPIVSTSEIHRIENRIQTQVQVQAIQQVQNASSKQLSDVSADVINNISYPNPNMKDLGKNRKETVDCSAAGSSRNSVAANRSKSGVDQDSSNSRDTKGLDRKLECDGMNSSSKEPSNAEKQTEKNSSNKMQASDAVGKKVMKLPRGIRRFVGLNRLNITNATKSTPSVNAESKQQDCTPHESVKDVRSSNSVGDSIIVASPDKRDKRTYHLRSAK